MRANRSSLLTRIGSGGLVGILAAGGIMASATVASAATAHAKLAATHLSIKKVVARAHHHADAISGVLSARHKGVAGETVKLESRTGKKPRWVVAGTAATAANGSVTFTVAPAATTQFKLVREGAAEHRTSMNPASPPSRRNREEPLVPGLHP
jgi:hypothetical protein